MARVGLESYGPLEINWELLMKLPRYAGGHDDHMKQLFHGADVLAHYNEGYYQGCVATCVRLADKRFAYYTDSYGSCSGCDSWEDADDDSIKVLLQELADSAKVFSTLAALKQDLKLGDSGGCGPLLDLLEALPQSP